MKDPTSNSVRVTGRGDDDELVAAEPRDKITFTHDGLQTRRADAQEFVACLMSADIVDLFEPVEVEKDQRGRPARRELDIESGHQSPTIQ